METQKNIEKATHLNARLKDGTPIWEVLDEIRSFPKPIVVDYNNVLVNNRIPHTVNPEAYDFLKDLKKEGDVFIVTTANSRETVHSFLKENSLWSDDMVLIVGLNYNFMRSSDSKEWEELMNSFIDRMKRSGRVVSSFDLIRPPAYKRFGPIFDKPFDVPIIDDSLVAVSQNPGMFGIHVQSFEPGSRIEEQNDKRYSLSEAVKLVMNHYSAIS